MKTDVKETPLAKYNDTPVERFKQINGSGALEGYSPTPELLFIQKSIIEGRKTVGDAIKELRASYGLGDAGRQPPVI